MSKYQELDEAGKKEWERIQSEKLSYDEQRRQINEAVKDVK